MAGDRMAEFAAARAHMIESQIRTNKVTDERVLDAFGQIGASCSCQNVCAPSPMSTRICRSGMDVI